MLRDHRGREWRVVILPPRTVGLGDALAALLARLGIHPWPNCRCPARRAWLNRWPTPSLLLPLLRRLGCRL